MTTGNPSGSNGGCHVMARVAQVDLIIYSQDGKVSEHRMRGHAH